MPSSGAGGGAGAGARAGPAIHPACSFLGRLLAMEGLIEEWAGIEDPEGS